jgi:hypothetical protein
MAQFGDAPRAHTPGDAGKSDVPPNVLCLAM